jgi:hypothetical protein
MRKGILGSLAVLTVGAGLTFGQPKSPPPSPGGSPPLPPGMGPVGPVGPDGQQYLAPPGFDPMVGGGGPMYGDPGAPDGPYGSGRGVLGSILGPRQGPPSFWASAEALYWVPSSFIARYPIATTSAPLDFGRVGGITSASLGPGPRYLTFEAITGWRGYVGIAFDESGQMGGEVGGFLTSNARRDYTFTSNQLGMPVLTVPFQDVNTGAQGGYVVSWPGVDHGTVNIAAQSQIYELEASGVLNLYQTGEGPGGLTLLAGPRFMRLREQLDVQTTSTNIGPIPAGLDTGASFFAAGGLPFAGNPAFVPVVVNTADRIKTTNDFYGAQVGFRGDIGFGGFFIELVGKFGAGYMRETVEIQGGSTGISAVASSLQPGGIYNLAQEQGTHHRDQFAVVGEGGINVGYQLLSFIRIQGGYTFMWVNHVVRPTRELSPVLNPNLIPTSPTYTGLSPATIYPRNITNETDYHIQGLSVGVKIEF